MFQCLSNSLAAASLCSFRPLWLVFNTMFTLIFVFVNQSILPQQIEFRVLKGARVSERTLSWFLAAAFAVVMLVHLPACQPSSPGRRRRMKRKGMAEVDTCCQLTWRNALCFQFGLLCFQLGFLTCWNKGSVWLTAGRKLQEHYCRVLFQCFPQGWLTPTAGLFCIRMWDSVWGSFPPSLDTCHTDLFSHCMQ